MSDDAAEFVRTATSLAATAAVDPAWALDSLLRVAGLLDAHARVEAARAALLMGGQNAAIRCRAALTALAASSSGVSSEGPQQ